MRRAAQAGGLDNRAASGGRSAVADLKIGHYEMRVTSAQAAGKGWRWLRSTGIPVSSLRRSFTERYQDILYSDSPNGGLEERANGRGQRGWLGER